MHRREFVTAGVVTAALPPEGARANGEAQVKDETKTTGPRVLELRRYRLRFGPSEARFSDYAKVLLPALNRVGVKPVGAFTVVIGPDSPAVYLLLSHPNVDSVTTTSCRASRRLGVRQGLGVLPGSPRHRSPICSPGGVADGRVRQHAGSGNPGLP